MAAPVTRHVVGQHRGSLAKGPTATHLVVRMPNPEAPSPDEDLELVTVFEASDGTRVALARLALEAAGIPFVTTGEGVQDYIGAGRLPGGYNLVTGPVRFQVERRDLSDARAALKEVG